MSDKLSKRPGFLSKKAQDASDLSSFLEAAKRAVAAPSESERGRLIFALDATMSRQPTWDQACHLQEEMFIEAGRVGSLDVQLVFFRGFGECKASRWVSNSKELGAMMRKIRVQAGRTQIRKVLDHALSETRNKRVQAVVYIGDCMEENPDRVCDRAGELGLLGVPVFIFQEGQDHVAEENYREIARLSNGIYMNFGEGSAASLRGLLAAIATFSAGGREALEQLEQSGHKGAQLLIEHLG
ncbi:hypothetical protein PsAD2_04248 [Pseudovibrio axinellae]|uniref:VWA domain-containing protein n=1 Tax=Pseudovibrio axinellae TaxID=989403 RepID=A0A165TWT2_9HYPH|nr:hypothetical protein [Pseudovibrio axinellae]KZL06735.1 hypothetical protein PsAD2_04248 [Pseudovibrio axinellae]SER62317.1 hypothetical protein SAMN05421798_11460 [Pseudovibrio axinellae]